MESIPKESKYIRYKKLGKSQSCADGSLFTHSAHIHVEGVACKLANALVLTHSEALVR